MSAELISSAQPDPRLVALRNLEAAVDKTRSLFTVAMMERADAHALLSDVATTLEATNEHRLLARRIRTFLASRP